MAEFRSRSFTRQRGRRSQSPITSASASASGRASSSSPSNMACRNSRVGPEGQLQSDRTNCRKGTPQFRFLTPVGQASCYGLSWRNLRRLAPESLVASTWKLRRLQFPTTPATAPERITLPTPATMLSRTSPAPPACLHTFPAGRFVGFAADRFRRSLISSRHSAARSLGILRRTPGWA